MAFWAPWSSGSVAKSIQICLGKASGGNSTPLLSLRRQLDTPFPPQIPSMDSEKATLPAKVARQVLIILIFSQTAGGRQSKLYCKNWDGMTSTGKQSGKKWQSTGSVRRAILWVVGAVRMTLGVVRARPKGVAKGEWRGSGQGGSGFRTRMERLRAGRVWV